MKKNDLKKLISSSRFLSKDQKADFLSKLSLMDNTNAEFFYQKFTDAEKKMENIFIAVALKNSTDSKSLIKILLQSINNT